MNLQPVHPAPSLHVPLSVHISAVLAQIPPVTNPMPLHQLSSGDSTEGLCLSQWDAGCGYSTSVSHRRLWGHVAVRDTLHAPRMIPFSSQCAGSLQSPIHQSHVPMPLQCTAAGRAPMVAFSMFNYCQLMMINLQLRVSKG